MSQPYRERYDRANVNEEERIMVNRIVFIGGPKDGVVEPNVGGPIPTQRIPIYTLAHSGMQCDDEQVIYKEGHYERFEITENGYAYYEWHEAVRT